MVRIKPMTNEVLSISDPGDDDESPSKMVVRGENIERLLEGLEFLDRVYQEIVEMHIFLDKTFEEIGKELGLATSTVYDRYRKALAMLKGFLK
jgi:RNA polymerase sigma factor (sigma-70 family)